MDTKFTPEFIQTQRELSLQAEPRPWRHHGHSIFDSIWHTESNHKNRTACIFTIEPYHGCEKIQQADLAYATEACNNYTAALDTIEEQAAEIARLRGALKLCLPIVQMDIYELESDRVCFFCGEEIDSGDEHKDDCEQLVAYLSAKSALKERNP